MSTVHASRIGEPATGGNIPTGGPLPVRAAWLFAPAIFLSAFLLFLVQPLIARIILPWFGGTAAVWTTCMMFFQVVLLLGYSYAYWLVGSLRPRSQTRLHIVLLAASLLVLPILPKASWKTNASHAPVLHILLLLAATVGFPYLVLSTTGPLLQAWYARLNSRKLPYRLYALSNAGSLLALLSYPVLVEPEFGTKLQAYGWSWLYVAFAVLCGGVAVLTISFGSKTTRQEVAEPAVPAPRPGWREQLLWVALAACPSALLLAITNHVTQNVSPIPLLWVVPLALYLLSLVLCFDSDRWYQRRFWIPLFLISLGAMAFSLYPDNDNLDIKILIPLFFAGLFCCCMACHGELARRKPDARWLTSFYLMLSIGGAIGGMFVALLAPVIFRTFLELPVSLLASALLVAVVLQRGRYLNVSSWLGSLQWGMMAGLSLFFVYLLTVNHWEWLKQQQLVERNFYGELRVSDDITGLLGLRHLYYGTIQHGAQYRDPNLRRKPITYYGPDSGVSLAIHDRQDHGPVKMGFIGLGAGTLAAFGRPRDTIRFYDINPLMVRIARTEFTYLQDCRAKLDIVMGDARRSLETEPPQHFDILAVDAFSSDAIPVHLLTHEAFREYFRHLNPEGILAVHISNRYLALEWVVRLAAQAVGAQALGVFTEDEEYIDPALNRSDWMLVSKAPHAFADKKWRNLGVPGKRPPRLRLWTDDYSNLLTILR